MDYYKNKIKKEIFHYDVNHRNECIVNEKEFDKIYWRHRTK
jgi:hypothetical protein